MPTDSPVLSVEHLGKSYRLGEIGVRRLRDHADMMWAHLWGRRSPVAPIGHRDRHAHADSIQALDDVTFSISRGAVVGIVGRNGAGKSTLLKILSRITTPTVGTATIRGRVASLLEVGTGFNPELTGLDNVFLNGAILGMTRAEIRRKLDAIIDFSGVEDFIDTPVKRYSSGMYVRLGFAVAAHLDPEVLIVDEVLAVGDAEFQRKCLGKMDEVAATEGRTVLFVSHNLQAIGGLCRSVLVFDKGRLTFDGPVTEGLERYKSIVGDRSADLEIAAEFSRPPDLPAWITRARVLGTDAQAVLAASGHLAVEFEFAAARPAANFIVGVVIHNANGDRVLSANTVSKPHQPLRQPASAGTVEVDLGVPPLMPGVYSVSLWFGTTEVTCAALHSRLSFRVVPRDVLGTGHLPPNGVTGLWWPAQFNVRGSK